MIIQISVLPTAEKNKLIDVALRYGFNKLNITIGMSGFKAVFSKGQHKKEVVLNFFNSLTVFPDAAVVKDRLHEKMPKNFSPKWQFIEN